MELKLNQVKIASHPLPYRRGLLGEMVKNQKLNISKKEDAVRSVYALSRQRRTAKKFMTFYDTPYGMIAVISNGFQSEEYTVVSLLKSNGKYGATIFAQLVGVNNPKKYIGDIYKVVTTKIDAKKNLYTIYLVSRFKYDFPLSRNEEVYVVSPSKKAAKDLIKKLTGLEVDNLNFYFKIDYCEDLIEGSKRVMAVIKQHQGNLEQFITLKRNPVYCRKGGELINHA